MLQPSDQFIDRLDRMRARTKRRILDHLDVQFGHDDAAVVTAFAEKMNLLPVGVEVLQKQPWSFDLCAQVCCVFELHLADFLDP